MGGMIAHAELGFDEGSDAWVGPEVAREAEGRGPLRQQTRQSGALLGSELGGWTRRGLVAQSSLAALPSPFEPLAHRSRCHAQRFGNLGLAPALLGQFPCPQPSAFFPVDRLFRWMCVHMLYYPASPPPFRTLRSDQ